jgi:SAM-dependent methyltransferase
MKQIIYDEYHEFLKKRSLKSHFYRNYWLYPFLCKHLSGKTLDIGPGLGDFVKFRKNTIGVDINPDNVGFCREERGLDVRLMDIDILPFKDDEFDSINLDNVLEHLEDPSLLLSEIDRVLKKGGTFLIGVPGIHGFNSAPDHEIYYSKNDLTDLITKRGYVKKNLYCMPFKCDWLFETRLSQYCYYGVYTKI